MSTVNIYIYIYLSAVALLFATRLSFKPVRVTSIWFHEKVTIIKEVITF